MTDQEILESADKYLKSVQDPELHMSQHEEYLIITAYTAACDKIVEHYKRAEKKAEKWDALDKKINAVYYDEHGEEQIDDEGGDLCTIGEMAAIAFGYL